MNRRTTQHNNKTYVKRPPLALMLVMLLVIGLGLVPAIQAGEKGVARMFGKTYGEWSAEWWTWALSIPDIPPGNNPVKSEGLVDCSLGQRGPVWFLAGATAAIDFVNLVELQVTRTCRDPIPRERSLFIPLANAVFINEPGEQTCLGGPLDGPCTVEEKRALLAAFNTASFSCGFAFDIDGIPVHTIPAVRAQSPAFYLATDVGNFLGFGNAEDPEAVSDGFWLMVPPLPRGEHVVHFGGAFCNPESHLPFFQLDITYEFTVGEDDDEDDDDDDDD